MTSDAAGKAVAMHAAAARATDFEVSLADLVRRSERRAWWVAGVALLFALLACSAVWLLLPLKERVPYLVMADAGTGRATLTRLSDDPEAERFTANEALARAHVALFVRARESYELSELGERDWSTVFAMAGTGVREAYAALHASTNAAAPHKLHGTARSIRVQILSLQLAEPGASGSRVATVRFRRSLQHAASGESSVLEHRIATLEYGYDPTLAMSEAARLLNPLGFVVTSYRADDDMVVPSPAAATRSALP